MASLAYENNRARYWCNRDDLMHKFLFKWVCLNTDSTALITETAADALRCCTDPDAFTICIGNEDHHTGRRCATGSQP